MGKKEQKERDRNLEFEFFETLSNWAGNGANGHITRNNIIDFVESGGLNKISDRDLAMVFHNYYEETQSGDRFETLMDADGDGICTFEEFDRYVEEMFEMTDRYEE